MYFSKNINKAKIDLNKVWSIINESMYKRKNESIQVNIASVLDTEN